MKLDARKWMVAGLVCSVLSLGFLADPRKAHALTEFNPGDLSDLQQTNIDELIKLVALGANHRDYKAARPLGSTIGLDLGIDVTAVVVPNEFKAALALAADTTADQVPSPIPLPRISLHKGLPGGIDIGASYVSYQGLFTNFGASLQWAFLKKSPVLPNASVRLVGSYAKLYFIQARNFALDALVSKRLAIFEPYIGAGVQYWNGKLDVSSATLPVSLSSSTSGVSPHAFFGLPIKLVFLKFVAEIDYNFSGVTSYGGKVALSF